MSLMCAITNKYPLTPDNSRVSFFCRMMEKALTRNDPGRYEIIHVVGQLKPVPPSANIVPASPSSSVLSPGGRSNSGEHISDCFMRKCYIHLRILGTVVFEYYILF